MRDAQKMKDEDIRPILFDYLDEQGVRGRFFEEFVLGRRTRADALLVREDLIGFEIKSDRDTLARLKRQIKGYHQFCDRSYIVVGAKYLEKVQEEVPENWGVILIKKGENEEEQPTLEILRKATAGPREHLRSQLHLLWRSELIEIIRRHDLGGVSGKNKQRLREMIYHGLPRETVRAELCEALIQRDYSLYEGEDEE